MKELVYELHPQFGNLKDNEADGALAKEWILDAWGHISQGLIDSLIDSLPRRRQAVCSARGWYTNY